MFPLLLQANGETPHDTLISLIKNQTAPDLFRSLVVSIHNLLDEFKKQETMPQKRTTPPMPNELAKLADTVHDAALQTVKPEYILADAIRLASAIRAVVAVMPSARFVNNRTLGDALLTAMCRAIGHTNQNWNLWFDAATQAAVEAGAREELTSKEPFVIVWLRVADVLDDLAFETAKRGNAERRKKTPAPTETHRA